ncbi:hypothetical protein [Terrisporobacter sp.]
MNKRDKIEMERKERSCLPRDFYHMFALLFENRKWTTKKFKDETLLSDNELSRLRKVSPQTSKRTLMTVCVGMELPFDISMELMKTAGIVLVDDNDEDDLYKYVLSHNMKIYEVNDLLERYGFVPLGQRSGFNK